MSAEITTEVGRAAEVLKAGGLVAFATETVYGLGANALDSQAVARVFEAKGRPRFDPLIVHLAEANDIDQVVARTPEVARRLSQAFWPGPLTLVMSKRGIVPDLVTSGLPHVAVRVPGHELARALIARAGCPVAAPSANLFGRVSPTTAEHVAEQLHERIDLILDGGPCRVGIESTILDVTTSPPTMLRPGGVTREEIEDLIGPVTVPDRSQPPQAPAAPGMLPQHYAPQTPVRLVRDWESVAVESGAAALAFRSIPQQERFDRVELLSTSGDLREAASRFFGALRRLDHPSASVILAELFPESGIGVALNDRLRRSAAGPHPGPSKSG